MIEKVEVAGKATAGLDSSPQYTLCLRPGQTTGLWHKMPSQKRVSCHPLFFSFGSWPLVCQGLNCKQSLEGRQGEQVWPGVSGNFPSSCFQQPKTQDSYSTSLGAGWQALTAQGSGQSQKRAYSAVGLCQDLPLYETAKHHGLSHQPWIPSASDFCQLQDNLRVGKDHASH